MRLHAIACVGLVACVDVEKGSEVSKRTRSKRRGAAFAGGVAPAPAAKDDLAEGIG